MRWSGCRIKRVGESRDPGDLLGKMLDLVDVKEVRELGRAIHLVGEGYSRATVLLASSYALACLLHDASDSTRHAAAAVVTYGMSMKVEPDDEGQDSTDWRT